MVTLRFVGTQTSVTGVAECTQFGQAVQVEKELAADLMATSPFLASAAFDAVGFTAEELKQFADPGTHADAPEEFRAKKTAALIALHNQREGV